MSDSEDKVQKKELKIQQKAEKKRIKLEKKANKKPMNPIVKYSIITVFALIFACCLTVCVVGVRMLNYVVSYKNGDSVINLDTYTDEQNRTSILYYNDSNGKKKELIRLHGTENREWVKINKIPENLQKAFVCLEDKRFYEHNGVDWIRTIGVVVRNSSQGGSTITQQLIKNLTKQNQVTYVRKFNEILKALNLEENYSKDDILEAYLNTIYLGSGCYGVKTAAEMYFDKKLSELTIAECAMLASLTQNPYWYNPYTNLTGDDSVTTRQQYCLACMYNQGSITEKQYKKALKFKLVIAEPKETTAVVETTDGEYQSYYVDFVIDSVIADLEKELDCDYTEAWQMVYCGGLKIETAVDMDIQEIAEDIYENRTNFPYSWQDVYGNYPQSAVTIMNYQGRVVAIVGGAGKKTGNRVKNRASTSFRQPGSSMKPLAVYGPCVDLGYIKNGSTMVLNKAIYLNDGTEWPRNYAGDMGTGEMINVASAVRRSLNTVPARLLNETLGVSTSYMYVTEKFHLAHLTENDRDLSPLAVGGTNGGVSTLEMASAYAVFGNGGKYYAPYSYYRVIDKDGKVILDNTNPEGEQVISYNASLTMLDILSGVTSMGDGTAYGCTLSGLTTYAKTGTTTDNYDKWMCLGSPYYVLSIWYGYDYPAALGNINLIPLTKTLITRIHSGLSTQRTFTTVRNECYDGE